MNWSDNSQSMSSVGHADDNQPQAPNNSRPLFTGDTGELPLDTRRALVQLLAGPALDGRRHGKLWTVLLRDEVIIRKRLAELFLDIVVDRNQQVAFTRQHDAGELEVPILLRRAMLTFIDSVVLLYLRQRLTQADAQGERAVVSIEEIHEELAIYRRATSTDSAGLIKRINASIEKIKKHSILQRIRASSERYEISPTLKLLFSAEEIIALGHQYKLMASGEASLDGTERVGDAESGDQ